MFYCIRNFSNKEAWWRQTERGLTAYEMGRDGTINCHTVRYNSLWWGQRKKTRQKESAQLVSLRNTQISQHCKPPFPQGLDNASGLRRKEIAFGGKGKEGKEKKEEEKASYVNHKHLPWLTSTNWSAYPRYSKAKNNCISFLLLCPLCSTDPTLPSAKLLPSVLWRAACFAPAIWGWSIVNTLGQFGEDGEEMGDGRDNTNTRATSPLVPIMHVTEESSLSQC